MTFLSKFSKPRWIRKFTCQLLSIIVVCGISYHWIDRPLAAFMAGSHPSNFLDNYNLTDNLSVIAYLGILLVIAFYAYKRLISHESTLIVNAARSISFAVPVSFLVKTELQFILGRFTVRYNGSNTLLFQKYPHAYGFHLFGGGGSFPSGHMCVFTTFLLMLTYYYPRLKGLAIIILSLLAFLLIFYNYHFLSDVIAGTYIGYIIAHVFYKLESSEALRP